MWRLTGKQSAPHAKKYIAKKVPVLINALIVDTGICIGQLRVDAKTNEIKGIPDMLDWLYLRGAVVTMDAIGCQKDITKILLGKGADFVFPVKDNRENLHKDIKLEMDTLIAQQQLEASLAGKYAIKGIEIATLFTDMLGIHQEFEKCHSRIGYYQLFRISAFFVAPVRSFHLLLLFMRLP